MSDIRSGIGTAVGAADVVPVPNNPDVTTLVFSLLRHILTALAAAGITLGGATNISDGNLYIIAGAIVGVASIVLALVDKIRTHKQLRSAAFHSARLGRPVMVMKRKLGLRN